MRLSRTAYNLTHIDAGFVQSDAVPHRIPRGHACAAQPIRDVLLDNVPVAAHALSEP